MTGRFFVEMLLNNLAAWYMTYVLYSTLVLGLVWIRLRVRPVSSATENALWRGAVLLGPAFATLRIALEHVDTTFAPAGPEVFMVAGRSGWTLVGISVAALLVTSVLVLRLARTTYREHARLRPRTPVDDPTVLEFLRGVCAASDRAQPRLTECVGLSSPVAIRSREICVPAGMLDVLPESETRAVLAHEVGHIVRKDVWWATLGHLLDRLFFMQPLQRMASRRIRETAEFLADDFAVRRTGDPEPLVHALTAFARTSDAAVGVSAFAPGSLLLRRVERVLRGSLSDERASTVALIVLAVGVAVITWLAPSAVPACDCLLKGF